MDEARRKQRSRSLRSAVLGAAFGSIAMIGFDAGALAANSDLEQACAAALSLRSPSSIERLIEKYPDHPCVPLMIASLPPEVLAKISKEVVMTLPAKQLKLIPKAVLQQMGINPDLGGTERTLTPKPPKPKTKPQY